MSVKYIPSQTTAQIFENNRVKLSPDSWLVGMEERFIRKVKKIMKAKVDKRYPSWILLKFLQNIIRRKK
jgi:hypothetical protein